MVLGRYRGTFANAVSVFLGFVLLGTVMASTARSAVTGLTLSATSVQFGNVVIGTASATLSVFVTNNSDGAVKFERIATSAPFVSAGNTCGTSLSGGQTCQVGVVCEPTASGSFGGALTFFSNKDQSQTV